MGEMDLISSRLLQERSTYKEAAFQIVAAIRTLSERPCCLYIVVCVQVRFIAFSL